MIDHVLQWISITDEPLVSCKAAVNRQRHAEHEAGARTAEPENRRGDLVGTAQPGDRLIAHDLLDGVRPNSASHGISEQTLYNWKRKYGGMGVGELRRLKQLEEENRKLKQLVADLSLDKHILQEVVRKKL